MKPKIKNKKPPSSFLVGSCDNCNKELWNYDSFVLLAKADQLDKKKRLCHKKTSESRCLVSV